MTVETNDLIVEALRWIVFFDSVPDDCDICEDGSVYHGLTMILPRGSVCAGEDE
jgi:hypothetical protein